MAKFLILSRGTGEAYKQLSPQEMQKVIQKSSSPERRFLEKQLERCAAV